MADLGMRAVEILQTSRRTHVVWLAWQESNPNWRDLIDPGDPGDEHHHRQCIAEYDSALDDIERLRAVKDAHIRGLEETIERRDGVLTLEQISAYERRPVIPMTVADRQAYTIDAITQLTYSHRVLAKRLEAVESVIAAVYAYCNDPADIGDSESMLDEIMDIVTGATPQPTTPAAALGKPALQDWEEREMERRATATTGAATRDDGEAT